MHGPHSRCAGGAGAHRPRGRFARSPHRRQGSGQRQDARRHREGRAGRHRSPIGQSAGADGLEGDRLDGADRPRPARADHRRPPDRQDRRRGRHHHQPEGQGPHLYLRRDRSEGVVDQERGAFARSQWRDGLHHRRGRIGRRIGRDAVRLGLFGLHDGRVLPRPWRRRADRLRRPVQASRRLPPGVAAAAPPAGS